MSREWKGKTFSIVVWIPFVCRNLTTVSLKRESKNAIRPSQLPNKVSEHLPLGFALLYLFAFFKSKSLAHNYVATSAQLRPTRPDQSQYAICRNVLLSDCATLISLTLTLPLPEQKGCSRYSHYKIVKLQAICYFDMRLLRRKCTYSHVHTHKKKKGRQRTDEERYTENRTKERVKKKKRRKKKKKDANTRTPIDAARKQYI